MSEGKEKVEIMSIMQAQAREAARIGQMPGGLARWVGKVVKKGFAQVADPQCDREWMWVEVTGVKDGRLVGKLQNRPFLATYLRWGDEVSVDEHEIIAADLEGGAE